MAQVMSSNVYAMFEGDSEDLSQLAASIPKAPKAAPKPAEPEQKPAGAPSSPAPFRSSPWH